MLGARGYRVIERWMVMEIARVREWQEGRSGPINLESDVCLQGPTDGWMVAPLPILFLHFLLFVRGWVRSVRVVG